MSHVAPHRWADARAGRLTDAELATMQRHAEACPRCAKARERVTRTTDQSFPALRAQTAPDLPWDSVRAKVHWALAAARRAQPGAHRSAWLGGGLAMASAAAVALLTGRVAMPAEPDGSIAATSSPAPVAVRHTATSSIATRPTDTLGLISRLAGDVMIDGLRADGAAFERGIGAGTVLATGHGRIDVQFGDASAFAVGPDSRVELRRFDTGSIELAVDGTIDVTVAPRAPDQRFVVIAGNDTIEVRGTQFRVVHETRGVRVACRHGLVAVRDARGERQVGAMRALDVSVDGATAGHALGETRAMTNDELAQLVAATPVTVPLWTETLAHTSAPLEISVAGKRAVRVDGVELGDAPLRVRVMPGRHTVEAADSAGRFQRAGWVDVAAGQLARLDVRGDDSNESSTARRRELDAGIADARSRLHRCTRAIAKAGVTDTFVRIEIAVDATGAVGFLNVLDTDLPSTTSECVQQVLRDIRFKPGTSATWREKIDL